MSRTVLGITLTILLISIPALLSSVPTAKAITTVYIQADGTISPTGAPIQRNGEVYTLTGNLNSDADGIVIERNGSVLDGAGYTLQGTNTPSTNGIYASGISSVTIRNINVRAFESGILLDAYSTFNKIIENNVEDNVFGIWLSYSSGNTLSGNNVANNWDGILLGSSSDNCVVFHNNFVNNTSQVQTYGSNNTWDDGYPSGGNYWSDYTGVDTRCGPNQDYPKADGMGDTPYALDSNNIDRYPLMSAWTPPSGHNVAVVSAFSYKTVIGRGFSDNITVYGVNKGEYAETFNITVYSGMVPVASNSSHLVSGSTVGIAFSWNTTAYANGNYTVSAYAWPVLGETNTADNNFTGGWVIVSIVGDITGPSGWPDGQVNMRDIAMVARAFGSAPISSNWNPNTDLNGDGIVNMKDIALVARNFGQHYP